MDGADLPGSEATAGASALTFDVGSNSADGAFGNYLVVNGHRVDQERTWVSERVYVPVPNEWLVQGTNTVEIHAGGLDSSCGVNFDDFVVSELQLELLGETAGDDRTTPFGYSMGDGSCGSNTSYVTEANGDVRGRGRAGRHHRPGRRRRHDGARERRRTRSSPPRGRARPPRTPCR